MGYLKNKMMKNYNPDFESKKNLFVCAKHFDDNDIQEYITENSFEGTCNFCNENHISDNNKTQVIAWDTFIKFIIIPINENYTDPANVLTWDNGYNGNYFDTIDLLQDIIELNAEYEIIEEISATLKTEQWCRKDYFSIRKHQILIYDWKEFSEIVKYKTRYIFYKLNGTVYDEGLERKRDEILEDIGSFIIDLDLIKEFPKNNTLPFNLEIYRARQHKKSKVIKSSSDIGPAPSKKARANRFSPEGIPMFYGAADIETARLEVIDNTKHDECISVGKFKPTKKLNLIDLRNIEKIGFFNRDKANKYGASLFLNTFVKSISEKISNEDKNLEYIPSQIIIEYFKFVLPNIARKDIHGIIYNSTQNIGKPCYAIFVDKKMCADESEKKENTLLILEKNSVTKKPVNHKIIKNRKDEVFPFVNSTDYLKELIEKINLNNSIPVLNMYKEKIVKKKKQYVFQKSLFYDKFKDFEGVNVNKFMGIYIFSEQISGTEFKPVYIGISRNLKRRMSDHLIRKNKSSATWAALMEEKKFIIKNKKSLIEKYPKIENLNVFFCRIDDNFKLHLAEILLVLHYKPEWNSFKTH